jgi:hypothetical protein
MRIRDPGLVSLHSAVRAAIVMPSVFAFADKVIGDLQVATFAAFGAFAMLVLVEFSGPTRSRLTAYVALACAGAANIAIGTLCSNHAWLAASAMGRGQASSSMRGSSTATSRPRRPRHS